MKRIILIIVLSLTVGCQASSESMFQKHVSGSSSIKPNSLSFYKEDSAMHGPLFFKFEVTPLGVEELVHMHSITAVETIPVVISGLSDMVSKKVSWWKPYASLSLMKKYLVWYNPRSGFGDWQMRFLAVDGGQAYFITTGNFDTAAYAIDPKGGKE